MVRLARERRKAVTRKAMVAEVNETQSKQKQKAQHTQEEIQALEIYQPTQEETQAFEIFLRLRFGMTSTEVSSMWRQYGFAGIARMQQEVYEEDMQNEVSAQWWDPAKAQTQEEELITTERKQHSTIEEKRSEEIADTTTGEIAATTTGSTKFSSRQGPHSLGQPSKRTHSLRKN